MFRRVNIELTEPICLCLEQKLAWSIQETGKGPGLCIWCEGCEAKIEVPTKHFRASFSLDKPYPGKPNEKKLPPPKVEAGDLVDFMAYLKRRRTDIPS